MRHHHKILLVFTILLILTSSSIARNTLTPTTPLPDNETLISASGSFALGFFNSNPKKQYIGLWYNQIPKRKIVWVANWAKPLVNSPGLLSIAPNGTLTITDKNLHVVWSSNTSTKLSNPIAQLLDNGNLVVKELNNDTSNYAWQGFDHPTNTLLAGMIMGVDFATGLNRTLTSWSSPEDPTPGPYHVYIETRGDPEVFLTKDRNRIWRSGPWVGDRFSGVPNMLTYQGINFSLVSNMSGVTYSYQLEPSVISVLFVTSSGSYQRAVWVTDTQEWDYYFSAPKDLCDQIGKCGNYGLCDMNESPICNCLNGFEPKNRVNWNTLNDWSDGCVRKHELECKNGADEFRLVSNVKLPQSEDCMVDLSLNLDDCKSLCLMNCSCTAYASAVADNSSGCVIWIGVLFDVRTYYNSISGQDLYVRLNAIDVPPINVPKGSSGSKSHNGVVVPVVVSLVAGILLISCVGCVLCMRKMKKRKLILGAMNSYNKQFEHEHRDESVDLPMFDFDTIIAATDCFSYNNKLGEGGFGPVYKGKLGDEEIAVKRLSTTSSQGIEEFKNEVMLIAKLQHVNLVRLLGYCIQGEERVLIYEYLPNRSLDAFLFDKEKRSLLNWNTRYQIITGIARGLLYLHHDSRLKIIHRDLKAGNILLDVDMIPKISDFGMARIFSGSETDFNTRKIVGTYGYMSPEYAMDGAFSIKSDVFSFGVLVLEIISGKKNRVYAKPPHINLLAHAWNLWKEGTGMQLVDDSMGDSFSSDEVLRCIKLGLLCVQEHPEDRPLMSSVIQMFSSDIKTIPQPKQPGFTASRYSQDSCSNERSITTVEPR